MPYHVLTQALPQLDERLDSLTPVNDRAALWPLLERLLLAHAPSGGANLPGAIGQDIAALAGGLGLHDHVIPQVGSTGNTAIGLGAQKDAADVVVVAHMDRPSFRVLDRETGVLYPICANRFPAGEYRTAAHALRFADGRLIVGAQGELIAETGGEADIVRFEASQGALSWQDTVVMAPPPHFDGEVVTGSGLDNSLGTLTALLSAAALASLIPQLEQHGRRLLFVFTDLEEGRPSGFFGHGAARLRGHLPPPNIGCVIVDAHNAGERFGPAHGGGASHATASKWGEGSIVPPNYHALAADLAAGLNAQRPGSVQMNYGYVSRSDDMGLSRWTRILGLTGPALSNAHTGYERAHLGDVQAGVRWLSVFLAAALNLAPELGPRYALG